MQPPKNGSYSIHSYSMAGEKEVPGGRTQTLAAPGGQGARRPTGTEPRMGTGPTLWAVRSSGLSGWAGPCASFFDPLARGKEEGGGDGEAQGLGGFEIDDHLKLHGLLYGETTRFDAFKNFVHVKGGPPIEIE